MRIAISAEAFHPHVDADTRTVQAVLDRLVDTGHQVLLLAPAPGLPDYRGCKVARIGMLEGRGTQVREALTNFAPDLVLTVSPGRLGRKALKHGHRLGVPTLVVQASPIPALEAEVWSRSVGRRADRVVATADWMVARLAELGRPDAVVWEPGTDTRAFNPALRDTWLHDSWARAKAKGGARVVVGHAGPLRRRYGVRRLVDAAQVPGTRLVVIGEGPQQSWIGQQVTDAKLPGAMGDGDLATALASMDIVVMPSEIETCGHLLRAAMASGATVIAPARGAAADIVDHENTGLLYDPEQPRALQRAVTRLMGDPELGRELATNARRQLEQRDWTTAVDELVAVHVPGALEIGRRPAA